MNARSLPVFALAVAAFALAGCPDYKKMALEHLNKEGYLEVELTDKAGEANVWEVKATKDKVPCTGLVSSTAMPGSSAADFNVDLKCKLPASEKVRVDGPLEILGKACDGGDLAKCVELGVLLVEGPPGERDLPKAREVQKKACDGGDMEGCNRLGFLHMRGLGGDPDEPGAQALYQKSCDAGNQSGCSNLARVHYINRRGKEAKELFEKACEAGDSSGCEGLGLLYREGVGVKTDWVKSRELFQVACDAGEMAACTNLALHLARGEGGSKNPARAKELLTKACKANVQPACEHLKRLE